jgi:uncharacterized protein YjdB
VVSDLIDQHPGQFAVVTYNIDDAFEVPWGNDRFFNFYSFAFTPELMVDGEMNCPSADYATCLGQRLGVGTDVTLDLSGTQVSGATWDIGARVCIENGGSSRTLRIYTAATLSHRSGLPGYSRNLLMQEVPTQDINLSPGSCQTVTQRITFDGESWSNRTDITVIAWAQEPDSAGPAAVFQAAVMNWPFPEDAELTTIEISPSTAELEVGETLVYTATGKDQNGNDFELTDPVWWTSGDGSGTFDPERGSTTPELTAIDPGDTNIICTQDGITGRATLRITGDPPVLSEIVVTPSATEMEVGQDTLFTAVGHDQYGNDIALDDPQWQATGDGSGTFDPPTGSSTPLFTAVAPGAVQVTCSEGGISGQSSVVITGDPPQLAAIAVSPQTATLTLGSSLVLTATGTDQYGDPFTPDNAEWSVSGAGTLDPSSGSSTTTFTATAAGSTTVTVEQDGFEATALIDITDQGLPKPRRIKIRHTP